MSTEPDHSAPDPFALEPLGLASPGLEPLGMVAPADTPVQVGDPAELSVVGVESIDLLAAALRSDGSDLASFERVLFSTLADSLPAGVVEVDHNRSMSDRVAGRPGTPTAIRIHLGGETLELSSGRHAPIARIAKEVRGVVISRKEVTLDEWTTRFAELLAQLAQQNAATRDALARLLGTV